jgi:hypothetical protein
MSLPYTFANQPGPVPLSALDVNFANVQAYTYSAGNVVGNAQGNITSVGTLTHLDVTGDITGATLVVNSLTGTLTTALQPNITKVGVLTSLSVNGNVVSTNLNSGVITATSVSATTLTGTLSTAAQPNITSVGSLTSVSVVGNTVAGNITTAGQISANNLTSNSITNTGNITSGNITNSGKFTNSGSATIVGNVVVGNLQVLGTTTTQNQANLTVTAVTITVANNQSTSSGINGAGLVAGNPGVASILYNNVSNAWAISNGISTGGNLTVTGVTALTGNVTAGNLSASGNVTSNNISVASRITVANVTITGVATATTAPAGTSNTQIATTAFVTNNSIPTGVIVMWSGSVGSIPSGWLLCNGTYGTPDLRDRFVVGAGSTYSPSNTGGSPDATLVQHTHTATVTDPGHNHLFGADDQAGAFGGFVRYNHYAYDAISSPYGGDGGTFYTKNTNGDTSGQATGVTVGIATVGSTATNANLPPYYALAYIMKS